MSALVASFFTAATYNYFRAALDADTAFGPSANMTEVDVHFDVDSDAFSSNATQDLSFDFVEVSGGYSDAGQETRRSQFPKVGANGTLPRSTRLLCGAVGLVVRPLPPEQMPTITDGDIQTADIYTLQALQQLMDTAMVDVRNNVNSKVKLAASSIVEWGGSRALNAIYGADSAAFLAGQISTQDRARLSCCPFEFGPDEQMTARLIYAQRTALPNDSAFRVRLWMRCLLGTTAGG